VRLIIWICIWVEIWVLKLNKGAFDGLVQLVWYKIWNKIIYKVILKLFWLNSIWSENLLVDGVVYGGLARPISVGLRLKKIEMKIIIKIIFEKKMITITVRICNYI